MTTTARKAGPAVGRGVYTLPDAAKILGLDLQNLRRWVTASGAGSASTRLAGPIAFWGTGRDRGFNFSSLIELYTVAQLRALGVTMTKIRRARDELADRFDSEYPFATEGILTDGREILLELSEPDGDTVLRLDRSGQTEFRKIIADFYDRIDFEASTQIADRLWPAGRNSSVVVDPKRAFGKPTISGTAIPTETIVHLLDAGETPGDVAHLYGLEPKQVEDARRFEHRRAA